jgi:hypothetical protein
MEIDSRSHSARIDYPQQSEVLTAVKMSMLIYWVVMPNGLVGRNKLETMFL